MTKIMNKGKVDVKKIGKNKTLITPAEEDLSISGPPADSTIPANGLDEEEELLTNPEQEEGELTIENSGHRSTYSDYSLGKEYDVLDPDEEVEFDDEEDEEVPINESEATERDFYTSNKQIDNQAWEIMAEEEFGKSVSELNDAQYDWIDQIMHDYGNNLDYSKKPSSETGTSAGVKKSWDTRRRRGGAPSDYDKMRRKQMKEPASDEEYERGISDFAWYVRKGYLHDRRSAYNILDVAGIHPEVQDAIMKNFSTVFGDSMSNVMGKQPNPDETRRAHNIIDWEDKSKYLPRPTPKEVRNKLKGFDIDPDVIDKFIKDRKKGESRASESVTSWWGGSSQSSLEFRSKVLSRAGYTGIELIDKEFWELPDNVQDKVFELYTGGYVGEAKLKSGYIQCPDCDQQFSNLQYLSDHIDERHEATEVSKKEWESASTEEKETMLEDVGFGMMSRPEGEVNSLALRKWEDLPRETKSMWGYYESKATEAYGELTQSQKNLLDDWIESNRGRIGLWTVAQDLPFTLYARLEEIKNSEYLYDAVTNYVSDKAMESYAKEFQPERQGKRVKLLTGDHAGKTGTIATVEIIGDGFTVRVDGVHNEYETGVNASPSEVEFLGGEAVLDTASNNGYEFSVIDSGYGELEVAIFSPDKTQLGTQKSIAKGWLKQSEVDEIKSMFQRDPEGTYKMLGGEAEPAGYYGFGSATGRMPPPEDWKQGGDMYKPINPMFNDFRNSGLTWNELPTDIQDAWKSERDYMVNEEVEGEATPESDVEELSKLNQLYHNEEEEQAQGEDETEDLELVSDLMDMELEEIGTEEFREDEHPRDHGKFTTKGGGDTERNKVLDDPSSSKQEREDAEKGLGKKDDIPTAEPKKEPKKEEPKYSHIKPNNPKRFNLIKSRVLKALGEPKDDWGKRYTDRVEKLEGFPTSGYQLEDLSVKYKAPILKAHLLDQHPNSKWSVKSEYFSGGSAIDAGYKGGEYPYGASEIGDVYSQRGAGYDSQTDYFPIDNYTHVYDQRENQPRGDPQTIAKDRPDRLWSWVNLKFDEENEYDMGRQWSRHIAEDIIKGKGDTGGGYQGVSDEMMGKIKQVYNDFVEQERKEKAGESFKKKLSEFEDSDRPVSPNSLMRYTEPIDLPTGKNAMDQTYGVSEPETPDGQDLTGITVGEEEIIEKKPPKIKYYYYKQYPFGRRAGKQNPFGEANEVSLRVMNRAHQWWDAKYPDRQWEDMKIGERQNVIFAFLRDPDTTILGEASAEEWMMNPQEDIDLPRIRELQDKIDNGTITPDEHTEMVDLVRSYVPMDDPDISLPYANKDSFPRFFESSDEGGQGSGRKPYASKDPDRKDKAHIGWKNYGIDDYLEKAEKEYEGGEEGRWDYVEGDDEEQEYRDDPKGARTKMEAEKELLDKTEHSRFPVKGGMDYQEGEERVIDEPRDNMNPSELEDWQQRRYKEYEQDQKASDYLEKIKYSMDKGGAKFQRGGEQFDSFPKKEELEEQLEDPTPWASLAHLGATTVKDILFPAKEEHVFSDMTDEELEELGDVESSPHQKEDAEEEEPVEKWDKDDDIGRNYAEPTGDDEPLDDDSYWQGRMEEAKEGGKGSGKKDHKQWMRAIEEEHTYEFCENCNMITEQVNQKCDMCGKKVE